MAEAKMDLRKILQPSASKTFGATELVKRINLLVLDYNKYEDSVKEQIKGYEETVKSKEIKIKELESRLNQLEKSVSILTTEDHKVKQVLKLYAQGKSVGTCYSILTEMKRVDIDFETIKNLIISLEARELENEYLEYYESEVQSFANDMVNYEEKNRIQKLRKLDEFGVIIEQYMAKLRDEGFDESELEKTTQILSLMKAYTSIVESSSKIMKGLGANSTEIIPDGLTNHDTERFNQKYINTMLALEDDEAEISYEEVN
jgi:hypothetical protein